MPRPNILGGGSSKTWNIEHGLSALPNANNQNTSNWKKFKLLLWKNWTIQKRHRWHAFLEVFLPVFCSILLIVARHFVPAEFISLPTEYNGFFVDTAPFETVQSMCNEIYYAPKNPATDQLMIKVRDKHFKFVNGKEYKVTGFESEKELLESYLHVSLNLNHVELGKNTSSDSSSEKDQNPILAGVIFTNSFEDGGESFPNNIEYTLRFPAKQRSEFDLFNERFGLKTAWYTDLIYPIFHLPGPRARLSSNGGLPGYLDEGFLYLQYAIETTITKSVLNDTEELATLDNYEIQLRRFPYPPYTEDKFLFGMQGFLPLLVMLSLIYPVLNVTRSIVLEKEKKLKESMKMMGLSSHLHWIAWIIRAFTFLIPALLLMTMLLKIRFTSHAIMEHTDPVVLFVILLAFSIQAMSISFAVTTLTNKANSGAVLSAVVWFVFFIPYFFIHPRYYILSRSSKAFSSLLTNSPIALALFILCNFEARGIGLQWANVVTGIGPNDNFCVADCLLVIVVNSIFYALFTIYVESVWPGEYGVGLPWNYPFTRWYWSNGTRKPSGPILNGSTSVTPKHLLETEPNGYAGIKIKGLSKIFGSKMAVKNLHINMYEGQITALLGHNGAGKTTTMSMLTGLFPPTSGTALINDFDIGYELRSVRLSLGICPQHDVLFEELTVEEHLSFFCLLKGFPKELVPGEIDKMLDSLGLQDKRNAQAHALSGGMRRKLSVSIAFCGGSKVVLLDEPTSGMDPAARRSCWDLIQNLKKGRTVLLSTHFMEEADLLGDRIAIMAEGELQCCGSSLFLKKKYGGGYHLTIVKDDNCDINNITNLLKKRIPDVVVDQNIGAELSYSLPDKKSSLFPQMFEELEARKTELGIASYGASITTMEEVFIRVGREAEKRIAEAFETEMMRGPSKISNGHTNSHTDISMGGSFIDSNSKTNLHEHSRRNTGLTLLVLQFRAMIAKKLIYIMRNRLLLAGQMCVPVFVLTILLISTSSLPALTHAPSRLISLEEYQKFGQVITSTHCENPSPVCEAFKETILTDGYTLEEIQNTSTSHYILGQQLIDLSLVNYRYIIGYEEKTSNDSTKVNIVGYFNNEPLHAPPLAYNLITNSILKSMDKNISIKISNFPFPYTKLESGVQAGDLYSIGFLVGYNLCFGMSFLSASFVIFLISERESRSKHLQYIAGVRFYIFWLANYFVDLVCFSISCLLCVIVLHIFKVDDYTSARMTLNLCIIFLVFGATVLPFMYLWSFAFTEPANGFIRVAMFNLFTGKVTMVVYAIITIAEFNLGTIGNVLNDIFVIFPQYAFGNGVVQMAKNLLLKEQCDFIFTSPESYEFSCMLFADNFCCTTIKENFFDWEVNGIGKNLVSMGVVGVASIIILIICELRVWEYFTRSSKQIEAGREKTPADEFVVEDKDVAEETERIRKTPLNKLHETDNLIVRDLTKYYGNALAVNKLNLGVQRGQTFGLLGVNGAGKTTTFKMLTGDYSCSSGDAFVYLHSIRKDIKGVYQNMGYCPQFDGLIGEMTGRETLRMIGRLRGIWEVDMDAMINKIAADFIFTEHLDKSVSMYSGGNKRKLSTAMALVGNPPIVFLDEPTTGMDPVARRHLWNALTIVRESGTSIVLTSHSMEECEILCSKLAIMVNGKFRCLGAPQHLKNKFSEGYTIIAQAPPLGVGNDYTREKQESGLRRSSSLILRKKQAPQKWEQALDGLRDFIEQSFPDASLKDIHPGFIHYHIRPSKSITWGKLFQTMEIAKERFKLDAYSVGQTSLEQVFLNFAKAQINID